MSDHTLPQEIAFEILLRLPVKTLLRCRCVCKFWNHTITHPTFMTAHFKHCILGTNEKDASFFIRQVFPDALMKDTPSTRDTLSVYHDVDAGAWQQAHQVRIELPFVACKWHFHVVDSINGLILFRDYCVDPKDTCILYNPSIRKCLTLPMPNIMFDDNDINYHCSWGFGFDEKNNDYKVVRLVYLQEGDNATPQVELYSLNDGVWRNIMVPVPFLTQHYSSRRFWHRVFLNGNIHWTAPRGSASDFLLLFDVCNETFREIEMPKASGGVVGKLGERLSIVYSDQHSYTFWIMEQYGVAESWTKLYEFRLLWGFDAYVGSVRSDELLFANSKSELFLYRPSTGERKALGLKSVLQSFYVGTYMESLVLLNVEESGPDPRHDPAIVYEARAAAWKQKQKILEEMQERLARRPRRERSKPKYLEQYHTYGLGQKRYKM